MQPASKPTIPTRIHHLAPQGCNRTLLTSPLRFQRREIVVNDVALVERNPPAVERLAHDALIIAVHAAVRQARLSLRVRAKLAFQERLAATVARLAAHVDRLARRAADRRRRVFRFVFLDRAVPSARRVIRRDLALSVRDRLTGGDICARATFTFARAGRAHLALHLALDRDLALGGLAVLLLGTASLHVAGRGGFTSHWLAALARALGHLRAFGALLRLLALAGLPGLLTGPLLLGFLRAGLAGLAFLLFAAGRLALLASLLARLFGLALRALRLV